MIGLVVCFVLILLAFGWLVLGGRGSGHEPTVGRRVGDAIDRAELEAAEREVQEATDEESVRDWGPGASGPRPPERL